MASGSACEKVLDKAATGSTTKLLEKILLKLPLLELLRAQRISRCWRDVIRGSIKIQTALFFQPFDKSSTALLHYDPRDEAAGPGVWREAGETSWFDQNGEPYATNLIINPFLDKRILNEPPNGEIKYPILADKWIRYKSTGYLDPNASCWKMLFTQQPLELIEIFCNSSLREFREENPQGIHLRDIDDAIFNHFMDCDECADEDENRFSWFGDWEVEDMYDPEVITGEEMLEEFEKMF